MHEESLELFESQSHLLDPESRAALQRQRQYLQWQSSLDEPGPMQSVLERQDSAGSGYHDPSTEPVTASFKATHAVPTAAAGGGALGGAVSGDTSSGGSAMVHELQETKRHLAAVNREREALTTRVQQLEAELQAQRESTLCKMCRQVRHSMLSG